MGDTHHDPSDHSRTTQPHAGIVMKDNFFWPGLDFSGSPASRAVIPLRFSRSICFVFGYSGYPTQRRQVPLPHR